jgi:polar amino acid transport system substrate-binding protein
LLRFFGYFWRTGGLKIAYNCPMLGCIFNRTLVAAVLAFVGFAAMAESPVDRYCSRPVRVALFEFGVMFRSASGDGIDAQLLDALQHRTGCSFVQVVLPRNRIWSELQNGSLDMATSAVPTPERKTYGYLLPYLQTRNVVLLKRTGGEQARTMAQFEASTLRLGVVRGFRHEEAYDSLIARLSAQGRVVEAVDVADNLRLLERGVVDAVLSQPIVYQHYLDPQTLKASVLVRDWAPPDQLSVGALILSRKSFTPEQARHWDALLAKLLKDGTMLKINRQFLPSAQARDLLYTGARSAD